MQYTSIYEQFDATRYLRQREPSTSNSIEELEPSLGLHSPTPTHTTRERRESAIQLSVEDEELPNFLPSTVSALMATEGGDTRPTATGLTMDPILMTFLEEQDKRRDQHQADLLAAMMDRIETKAKRERKEEREVEREAARSKDLRLKITPIHRMGEDEDILEYIELFEANQEARDIPTVIWPTNLLPLLNSTCRAAVTAMAPEDRKTYRLVKEELMNTVPETYKRAGESFFTAPKKSGESIQTYLRRLKRLAVRFALKDNPMDILDAFIIERTLQWLPTSAAASIRDRRPDNLRDLGHYCDEYFGNHGLNMEDYTGENRLNPLYRKSYSEHKKPWRQTHAGGYSHYRKSWKDSQDRPSEMSGKEPPVTGKGDTLEENRPPAQQQQHHHLQKGANHKHRQKHNNTGSGVICYKCNEKGHIAPNCPLKVNLISTLERDAPMSNTCIVSGSIGQKRIRRMLVDSGAEISVVVEDLVPQDAPTIGRTRVQGATGGPVDCRTVSLPVTVKGRSFTLEAAVLPKSHLSFPVLLGKNTPGLQIHWSIGPEPTQERKEKMDADPRDRTEGPTTPRDVAVLTRNQKRTQQGQIQQNQANTDRDGVRPTSLGTTPADVPEAQKASNITLEDSLPPTPTPHSNSLLSSLTGTGSGEEDNGNGPSSNLQQLELTEDWTPPGPIHNEEIVPEIVTLGQLNCDQVSQLQKDDSTLGDLWASAREDLNSQYCVKKGQLGRVALDSWGKEVWLLVLPTKLRKAAWETAHSSPISGHLGVKRTRQKLSQSFFWPGMSRDVTSWCKTCGICQKGNPYHGNKATLHPLPVISRPWEQVALDVVGPLKRTKQGNVYILTLMDFASRWPEAIPLKKADAEATADAMLEVFSRHGIPSTILTDNGQNFVGKLITNLTKKLNIEHLKTTPYRPQTNGMLERFHATLKRMLGKKQEAEKNWDLFLPYVLFAYRTTIHSSTGFSPYQLLYGREARGPEAVLKEAWTGEEHLPVKTAQYLLDVQKRLELGQLLMAQNDKKSKDDRKRIYDRQADEDPLIEGEEVLVRLPVEPRGLVEKWQGPFRVMERVSPVIYKISAPLRGVPGRKFHRNSLKRFIREVAATVLVADGSLDDAGQLELVPHPSSTPQPGLAPGESDSPGSPTDMTDQTLAAELPEDRRQQLTVLLQDFKSVFSDTPGKTDVLSCSIQVTTDQPFSLSPYRVPEKWKEPLQREIEGLLELGVIRESDSPYSSPVVCVHKPDGSLRMCTDFRKLNSVTVSDPYPLPRTDELLERASRAKYMSTLDLAKGYYQVPIEEPDRHKTAFITTAGKFEYNVLPFGLKNAPSIFQRLMDRVLKYLPRSTAYIDDILITSDTWDQHLSDLRETFIALRKAGLTTKLRKCSFVRPTIDFLGHTVGRGHLRPQAAKTLAVEQFRVPKRKKDLRAFLGLSGYYRKFIPDYGSTAATLNTLLKKTSPDILPWKEKHQQAFEKIKTQLTSDNVLVAPDYTKQFRLHTDASYVGLGAVLTQPDNSNQDRPVAYFSRRLLEREKNYSATEIELLSVVEAVKHFSFYLLGQSFILRTDHKALLHLNQMRNTNSRLTRWCLALQPFSFEVEHKAGLSHLDADGLSRQAWPELDSGPLAPT